MNRFAQARRSAALALALLAPLGCGGGTGTATPAPVASPPAATPAPETSGRAIETSLAVLTFDSAWNRIAHTHYDTTFRGVDWSAVRAELRPRAEAARTYEELRTVMRDMLARLGESHYSLIPGDVAGAVGSGERSNDGAGDVGMELRVADGAVLVSHVDPGGPAAAAGLGAGWIVEAIGGRVLQDDFARVASLEATPAHRLALTQFLWSVNGALDGTPGSIVEVTVRGEEGGARAVQLTRRTQPGEPVTFGNLPTLVADLSHSRVETTDGCVGVIRFNLWMAPVASAFDRAVDAVRDCTGVVIDLRGNPGGVAGMVMGIAGHFTNERTPLGVLKTRSGELRLVANPRTVNSAGQAVEPFSGPVALLIDPLTVSTSEIFAAGLQAAGRARVFGQTSAGQALPAMAVRLPNEDVLMHVVADLTVPDGTRVEGRGVVPDVAVPLRREDLLAGRDAALEAAVTWVLSVQSGISEEEPSS